jgi:hypothetical protein
MRSGERDSRESASPVTQKRLLSQETGEDPTDLSYLQLSNRPKILPD